MNHGIREGTFNICKFNGKPLKGQCDFFTLSSEFDDGYCHHCYFDMYTSHCDNEEVKMAIEQEEWEYIQQEQEKYYWGKIKDDIFT